MPASDVAARLDTGVSDGERPLEQASPAYSPRGVRLFSLIACLARPLRSFFMLDNLATKMVPLNSELLQPEKHSCSLLPD